MRKGPSSLPPPPPKKTGSPWTVDAYLLPSVMANGKSWPKISVVFTYNTHAPRLFDEIKERSLNSVIMIESSFWDIYNTSINYAFSERTFAWKA
jgi:hypothetical protein